MSKYLTLLAVPLFAFSVAACNEEKTAENDMKDAVESVSEEVSDAVDAHAHTNDDGHAHEAHHPGETHEEHDAKHHAHEHDHHGGDHEHVGHTHEDHHKKDDGDS
jgi:predicted small secreted protein